ncbi:MAG: thioredoxin family protein [Bacteroidetes bacterium]|nr:thioredoxin family protein [Bacteroidota bacterium]MBL0140124.1 thioredoxin family protein [Bacteroidota bacterium]
MKTKFLLFCLLISSATIFAEGYKIGDIARDFSLKNVDGKNVALADFKNAKGYIVVFTCNHCPFSKAYESRIMGLDKKYASLGYPVIAINPNDVNTVPEDSYDNMVVLAKEKNYTFPYLYDESQLIASTYGAARTPHVFVIQKVNGNNVVKYIGAIDNNADDANKVTAKFVENAVDALLAGKEIPLAETKAIGCTIKWKQ